MSNIQFYKTKLLSLCGGVYMLTEERLEEIKFNYENSTGVAYERWDYSKGLDSDGNVQKSLDFQAIDDMSDLLQYIEYLENELK